MPEDEPLKPDPGPDTGAAERGAEAARRGLAETPASEDPVARDARFAAAARHGADAALRGLQEAPPTHAEAATALDNIERAASRARTSIVAGMNGDHRALAGAASLLADGLESFVALARRVLGPSPPEDDEH